MQKPRTLEVIGVPSDLGANIRGANMGPASIRIAGLKSRVEQHGLNVIDLGDIDVPIRESLPPAEHELKFLMPIQKICRDLARTTESILDRQHIPLILGGDHSVAIGSIGGILAHFRKRQKNLGVIWIDAHADVNIPETSPYGNIHGMPLAVLTGQGHPELLALNSHQLAPQNCVLIGIRDIDDQEKEILRASGIVYYTMRDLDEKGMFTVMREAIAHASDATAGIHVSFDLDAMDPRYAPGVSTAVSGGLTLREAHLGLEMLAETKLMVSIEFMELNPFRDVGAQSANLVVDLLLSALGQSIV